jgi:hypothetical protein
VHPAGAASPFQITSPYWLSSHHAAGAVERRQDEVRACLHDLAGQRPIENLLQPMCGVDERREVDSGLDTELVQQIDEMLAAVDKIRFATADPGATRKK